jgi:PTH1 family peptidyl-tRNA hydrolase
MNPYYKIKLLIGLGNPGNKYQLNRHNIGFMTVDALAQNLEMPPWIKNFHGFWTQKKINGETLMLLKPTTFMNKSGVSVSECMNFYKLKPDNLLVIHDDLDLQTGKIKIKMGGGDGGHNGLKSISNHLGRDYYRFRIGIGHPGDKNLVSSYVLEDFTASEMDIHLETMVCVCKKYQLLLTATFDQFLQKSLQLT